MSPSRRLRFFASAALVLLLALLPVAASAAKPINQSFLGGVAIEGADTVAYHTDGKYVAGSADFVHEWNGAEWRFASAANRDLFAGDPERYAPQYGGYCAYAVSQGATAGIDPEAWKIVDGKLYLNLNASIQKRWEKDIAGYIAKADANWPGVLD